MAEPSTLLIISLGFEDEDGHSVAPDESVPASTTHVDSRSTMSCDVPKAQGLLQGEASQGLRTHIPIGKPGEVGPMASLHSQGPPVELASTELRPQNPTTACGCVPAGSGTKGTEGSEVEGQKRGMRLLQTLNVPHLCAATWLPDGRALVSACRGVALLYQVEGETLRLMTTFPLCFWPKAIQASVICENDGGPDQFFLHFATAAGLAAHLVQPPDQGNDGAVWTASSSHVMEPVWQMCAVTVSPDGALLAAAGLAGQLWIWDVLESFCLLAEEHVPFERVTSLAFSPDGRRLAIACWGGAVLLYHSLMPPRTPAHLLHSQLSYSAPPSQSPTTPCAMTPQLPLHSPCTAESATDLGTSTHLGDLLEVGIAASVQPSGAGEVDRVSHVDLIPASWEDILSTSSPDDIAGAHDVLPGEGGQGSGTTNHERQCSRSQNRESGPGDSCSSHAGPGTQVEIPPSGGAVPLRPEVEVASELDASAHFTTVPDMLSTTHSPDREGPLSSCTSGLSMPQKSETSAAAKAAGSENTGSSMLRKSLAAGRAAGSENSGVSLLREAKPLAAGEAADSKTGGLSMRMEAASLAAGEAPGSEHVEQEQGLLKKALRSAAPSHLWLDMPDPTGSPASTWALANFIPGEAAVQPDRHGPSLLAWCSQDSIVLSCRGEPIGYLTVTGDGSMNPGGWNRGADVEAVHESVPSALDEMDSQEERDLAAAQTPIQAPLFPLSKEGGIVAPTDVQPGSSLPDKRLGSDLEIRNSELCEEAWKPDTALFQAGQTDMEGLLPEFASLPFLPVPPREGGTAALHQGLPEVGNTPGYTESVLGSAEEAIAGLAVWGSGVSQVVLVLHQDGLLRAFPYPP